MPLKILLVEDNAGDAELVLQAFASAGSQADIVRVDRLQAAMAALRAGQFDVVVLDLMLPDSGDPYRTLAEARRLTNGTPIVVHSGCNDVVLSAHCRDDGARGFCLKAVPSPLPTMLASMFFTADEDERDADAALERLHELCYSNAATE